MNKFSDPVSSPPGSSFRDRLATMDATGKRKWVFAKKPAGRLYRLRTIISLAFFALFVSLPLIHVNGHPLFLLNVFEAKFILFGKIFWPQDFFILGLGMIVFIVFIVLFTAAFGRLFCGWVCPQTIFMEMLFRKIEFFIDGDAGSQRQLKSSPMNAAKIWKRLSKHSIFFVLSFIIGNIFLAYLIGTEQLLHVISDPGANTAGLSGMLVFSVVFYMVYAWFREQVCTAVCPYGRLQSVLLDKNSMVVAYDHQRGEPRGKLKKMQGTIPKGDCVDCFQCVRVCPTGIDIRNGTQMECIGCTACIDACDQMMKAINLPVGLVRYASENSITNKAKFRFTTRMKFYTVLLAVLAGVLSIMLVTRKDVDGTIVRAPGLLYQERGTDSISNLYTVNLINKTNTDISFRLALLSIPGRVMMVDESPAVIQKEAQAKYSFFVILPNALVGGRKSSLDIGLFHSDTRLTTLSTTFMGPFNKYK